MTSIDEWVYNDIPEEIMDQASDWIAKLDGDTATIAERVQFYRWLDQSPVHKWAFEEISEIWARVSTLSELKTICEFEREEILAFPGQGVFASPEPMNVGPAWWQSAIAIGLIIVGMAVPLFG